MKSLFKLMPANSILIIVAIIMIPFLQACKKDTELPIVSDEDAIKALMIHTGGKLEAPGWIVGVKTPSVFHYYAGGYADIDKNTPMNTTDLLRIGSITKTFTASLALILCDEGILSLDKKLADYFPEFPNSEVIELSHLLNHTSGLVTWDENEEIRNQIYNGTGDWTIDKLIGWASTQNTLSGAGEQFHYSNIGYFLVGKIIEMASGQNLGDLIETKICQPLNLENTFLADSPSPTGDNIHGYDGSFGTIEDMTGTPRADAINFELAWSAGGMLSTVEDLVIWANALTNGELLSESMHTAQMPVLNPPTEQLPYWSGYGFGIDQTDAWMGHTGAISGFICYMQRCPDEDVTIITFFNKFSAFDIDANTADIMATADNFLRLARYMCPETLVD